MKNLLRVIIGFIVIRSARLLIGIFTFNAGVNAQKVLFMLICVIYTVYIKRLFLELLTDNDKQIRTKSVKLSRQTDLVFLAFDARMNIST